MSVNNKIIDIEKLSRYHENLKEVLNTKEAAGEAAKAEAAAKKYADEEIAKLSFDEAGAAAEAYDAAKEYADDLVKNEDGSVKFDDKGAASTAEQNAKDFATGLVMDGEKVRFDAAGSAAAAQSAAESYADGLATNYDAAGSASERMCRARQRRTGGNCTDFPGNGSLGDSHCHRSANGRNPTVSGSLRKLYQ